MKKLTSILTVISAISLLSTAAFASGPYDQWCPQPSAISTSGTAIPSLYVWQAASWNYAGVGFGGSHPGSLISSSTPTPMGFLFCTYNSSEHAIPSDARFDISKIPANLHPYVDHVSDPTQGFVLLEGLVPAEKK